ncbi:MAG TPA: copper amine oxidase N-terminal domain-containing protein [Symbiobacteriaceae bacterium]|nr:copper amine oxidase N-terminal domain-containing protein [Symbiobacteriaceae bacterium]
MRRIIGLLLVSLLLLMSAPAMAAIGPTGPTQSPVLGIDKSLVQVSKPTPIAYGAVPNRYTDVDPATVFDLNGDLTGDIQISATTVTGKNGATVQLIDPAVVNLDQVQNAPQGGYAATAGVQLSRVYVAKLSGGTYAKFMVLQASPKVTIWFAYGSPTTSILTANGVGGHATLTWDALPDAALGYNVYRYEFLDGNSYTVTTLNDFTVQDTTFTDNTALNHYYLYMVQSIKANGGPGSLTTVAPVNVQSLQRSIVVTLAPAAAKLDGAPVALASAPVIRNGRLMVPASLLESAGVKVTTGGGQVTLSRRLENVTYTTVMTIDSPDYTWNGSQYKADVPPYMAGSTVMVPLRVVAPALGFGVNFDSTTRTATIQWFE